MKIICKQISYILQSSFFIEYEFYSKFVYDSIFAFYKNDNSKNVLTLFVQLKLVYKHRVLKNE